MCFFVVKEGTGPTQFVGQQLKRTRRRHDEAAKFDAVAHGPRRSLYIMPEFVLNFLSGVHVLSGLIFMFVVLEKSTTHFMTA